MIFDIHIHQEEHSSDSKLNVYEAIEIAKARGLDGICVTDHDSLGLRKRVREIEVDTNFKVIVGVEIFSLDGDLLCFGIDEIPEERLSAQATIDFVNERGGICIAAHPYRNVHRGLGDMIMELDGLAAIEGFNGRTDNYCNFKATTISKAIGLPVCGGSDSHTVGEIGNYGTLFKTVIDTEMDFIEAVKRGMCEPVSLTGRQIDMLETA